MSDSEYRKVVVLPEHVANKIAAGEVVERPSSVVKELLENAIDAGANRIDITVEGGGCKRIEIRDNGCGMTREDALLSLERQATSKIREVEDIESIDTLGFRGEAIPSIASVSRMTIVTRRNGEDVGTELVLGGGSVEEVRDIGAAPGTTVNVRDLFFNVPVRRKFLRAPQTELTHIKTIFTVQALAHPSLAMSLMSDGRLLYRFPGGGTLMERVADVFGNEFASELREVAYRSGEVGVSGFIGLPSVERTARGEQYVFVNGRPATAPIIQYALREALGQGEAARRPAAILFIVTPPETVDVNVHPTKREVRFTHPNQIRDAVMLAIRSTLSPPVEMPKSEAVEAPLEREETRAEEVFDRAFQSATICFPQAPQPEREVQSTPSAAPLPPPPPVAAPVGEGLALFDETAENSAPWKWAKAVGIVSNRYLLAETDLGIVTISIRAARERVLYERMLSPERRKTAVSQKLLIPETVRLSPPAAARVRGYLGAMADIGFLVEDFGGDHFKIDAIPADAAAANLSSRELMLCIAEDIDQSGVRRGAERWREEAVARTICKMVPRKVTALRLEDAQQLVDELAACDMPYLSAQGKPTMIFSSFVELDRKFGN